MPLSTQPSPKTATAFRHAALRVCDPMSGRDTETWMNEPRLQVRRSG